MTNNSNNHNNPEKLHGCTTYTMQPCNSVSDECNTSCNSNATVSLKAAAKLTLQRNQQCSCDATNDKNRCNFIPEKTDKKLHTDLISKYGISIQELKEFLDEDWDDYKDNPESLELWADLLFKNNLIKQGKVPDNFTAVTYCDLCGYVYVPSALANGGNVLGCPWCWNRINGLQIPKPTNKEK